MWYLEALPSPKPRDLRWMSLFSTPHRWHGTSYATLAVRFYSTSMNSQMPLTDINPGHERRWRRHTVRGVRLGSPSSPQPKCLNCFLGKHLACPKRLACFECHPGRQNI